MSIVRWDPFRDLVALQGSINQFFEQGLPWQGSLTQGWTFPVDIKDTKDSVVVRAEIPGVNRDEVKVTYDDSILTIRGERRKEAKEEGSSFIRVERRYGAFSRSFALDVPVEKDRIKASYRDGVLEILLPKKPQDKTTEISVDFEG